MNGTSPNYSKTGFCAAFYLFSLIGITAVAQPTDQENWLNFRGPTFNGTSLTANPPLHWSETKNVKWKVELPGSGNNSSPIVWNDRVIVLDTIPESQQAPPPAGNRNKKTRSNRGQGRGRGRKSPSPTRFVTLCFDRETGKKIWEQVAVVTTPHQGTHPDHGYASASPVSDGRFIYSHFGSRGLYCYDMQGNLQWKRDDFGQMMTRNGFGEGSTPCLYQDLVIVPWDHEGESWVMALDARTGKTRWKTERDEPSNWVTPVVAEGQDGPILITGGENFARGYDLDSGEERWRSSGFTSRPISSPVIYEDLALLASSRRGFYLGAMKIDGRGNLNETDGVVWSTDAAAPDVPSMMLSEGRVYYMKGSTNILYCLNAKTGETLFTQRLPGIRGVYASIVGASGKVFIVGRDGSAVVLKDSDQFELLAENQLDDLIDATPALAGGQLFLRGKQHLYCIEKATGTSRD